MQILVAEFHRAKAKVGDSTRGLRVVRQEFTTRPVPWERRCRAIALHRTANDVWEQRLHSGIDLLQSFAVLEGLNGGVRLLRQHSTKEKRNKR